MRILLDTHTLLWAAKGVLPTAAQTLIEDTANDLYFSPANIWEIELKKSKLALDSQVFYQSLVMNSYQELKITTRHVLQLSKLPSLHADPFDRILLAQALCERITLLTSDATLKQYGAHLDCILHY